MPMSTAAQEPRTKRPPRLGDRLYRMSVEQYHRMIEEGIIDEGDRLELLQGLLVTKMTKGQPHIICSELVLFVLGRLLPPGWFVSSQNPVTIVEDDSEPEPDIKVVRGHPRDYSNLRIAPEHVALVIEIADSSYSYDLKKRAMYAKCGIPVYGIINLNARRLEVYTDPTGPDPAPDYRSRADFGPDDEVPIVLDGREVARVFVRDLLP
jgi:Uma2 family endonuclease